ncbi:hypothetical protein [Streptomyces sp. NPDC045251]
MSDPAAARLDAHSGWLGTMLSGRRKAEEQRRHYEAVEGSILAGAVHRGE